MRRRQPLPTPAPKLGELGTARGFFSPPEGAETSAELGESRFFPADHPAVEEIADGIELVGSEIAVGAEVKGQVAEFHQDPVFPHAAVAWKALN